MSNRGGNTLSLSCSAVFPIKSNIEAGTLELPTDVQTFTVPASLWEGFM